MSTEGETPQVSVLPYRCSIGWRMISTVRHRPNMMLYILCINNNCFSLYGHLQVNMWILKTSMSKRCKQLLSINKIYNIIFGLWWTVLIILYPIVINTTEWTNHSLPYCYQHNGMDSNEYNIRGKPTTRFTSGDLSSIYLLGESFLWLVRYSHLSFFR
jgi:hypothetical protein